MSTETEKIDAKTHWKKLTDAKYLGSHDFLPGQEFRITFDTISKETVKNSEGKDEQVVVAKMKNAKKPWILNKTNMREITRIVGSPYIEQWSGCSVVLFTAKVKAFGELVDAVRVKAELSITNEDISKLYESKKEKMSPDERTNAERIISKGEKDSYPKLKKELDKK